MTQVSIHETSRSMSSRSGTQNGKAKHTDIVTTVVMMVQNKPRDDDAIWRFDSGQRGKRVITRIRPCPTQLVTAHMISLRSARKVVCTAQLAGMLEHNCTLTPTSFSPGPKALSAQKTFGQMMELEGDAQLEMGAQYVYTKGWLEGPVLLVALVVPDARLSMASGLAWLATTSDAGQLSQDVTGAGLPKTSELPSALAVLTRRFFLDTSLCIRRVRQAPLRRCWNRLDDSNKVNKFGRHLLFDSTTSALALVHLLPGMAQAAGLTIRLLSRLSAFPPPIHASTWRCCPSRRLK